jgi:hypothetical protein
MLFLLGAKFHPAVRVLIAAALLVAGIVLHSPLTDVFGALGLVWGGYLWVKRVRMTARRDTEGLRRTGEAG